MVKVKIYSKLTKCIYSSTCIARRVCTKKLSTVPKLERAKVNELALFGYTLFMMPYGAAILFDPLHFIRGGGGVASVLSPGLIISPLM